MQVAEPVKVKIACPKCGYTWYTISRLIHVTCPSCQYKVKNPAVAGKG